MDPKYSMYVRQGQWLTPVRYPSSEDDGLDEIIYGLRNSMDKKVNMNDTVRLFEIPEFLYKKVRASRWDPNKYVQYDFTSSSWLDEWGGMQNETVGSLFMIDEWEEYTHQ